MMFFLMCVATVCWGRVCVCCQAEGKRLKAGQKKAEKAENMKPGDPEDKKPQFCPRTNR